MEPLLAYQNGAEVSQPHRYNTIFRVLKWGCKTIGNSLVSSQNTESLKEILHRRKDNFP